jgi:pimeloyl-ACP methyl ester carboxylesterase
VLLVNAGASGAWFEPLAGLLPGRVVRVLRAGYTGGPPPRARSRSARTPRTPPRCSTRWAPDRPPSSPTPRAASSRGGASPGPTHRLVERMAAPLPRARVATVDGADHLLPLTHPRELAALVATAR